MEQFLKKFFLENIHRKLFSLFCAIVIWITINHSITSTRTFTRVPIRIVNLPFDKTIRGLMPNGTLDRKVTLTLTGTKDVINKLESNDLEVVVDAADKGDEWVVQISKKNLVCLNPEIELIHNIRQVSHSEFVLHLCRLVTEKIPIWILPPKGEAPEGYELLDVWPSKLFHIISGPEEDVKNLQEEGLELSFDIGSISKTELDELGGDETEDSAEVGYFVPESWKRVQIPFLNNTYQSINGQEAKQLRIDFLRKEFMPIEEKIPIQLFYPPNMSAEFNPQTVRIVPSDLVTMSYGIPFLNKPVFVNEVSKLFLDIVRDRIQLVVIPIKRNNALMFRWQVQFIDARQLEEMYVALTLSGGQQMDSDSKSPSALLLWKQHLIQREKHLRMRFREYVERFRLYFNKEKQFLLDVSMDEDGKIFIKELEVKS